MSKITMAVALYFALLLSCQLGLNLTCSHHVLKSPLQRKANILRHCVNHNRPMHSLQKTTKMW